MLNNYVESLNYSQEDILELENIILNKVNSLGKISFREFMMNFFRSRRLCVNVLHIQMYIGICNTIFSIMTSWLCTVYEAKLLN